MERLIILSDLFGKAKSEWLVNYVNVLQPFYEIVYYDCCELGGIDPSDLSEERLHEQFVNGGIELAVKKLIAKEQGVANVLGFSIGGYIAWKAALEGLKFKSLTALSSTRIRYESQKPSGILEVYFGENDLFQPEDHWCKNLDLVKNIIKGEEHELYKKREIAEEVCRKLIEKIKIL